MLLAVLLSSFSAPARAHEVVPVIADFTVEEGTLTFDMRMNVEAFVAGIDLDMASDTSDTPEDARYDDLRAMPPEALEPLVQRWADTWLPTLGVNADGPVALSLDRVEIAPVGDTAYTRETHLFLTGTIPDGAREMRIAWPEGSGDVILRQQGVEEPFTGILEGGETSDPIALGGGFSQTALEAFATYIPIGFDHILPKGLDHILFVLGIFLLSTHLGPLLWQVTAFTLAHTITLALGALHIVVVPAPIVEPIIALSITYVAVENILTSRLHAWRPVVVFVFGLLHGLGFASVLEEFGLPEGQFIPALLGFNVGVELGQLAVIAIAFALVGYWFSQKPWYRQVVVIPASAVIAIIGAYWFVERAFL